MGKVKGKFDVAWGPNVINYTGEISYSLDQDTEAQTTVQHNRFEVDGGILAKATLTFLHSDIPTLAAVLPQYYKAMGEVMSTGETVTATEGAMDYGANCDDDIYHHLEVTSCGDPGQTFRIVDTRTRINSVDNNDKLRTVKIDFIGEPEGGVAAFQWFAQGGLSAVS
jgi:hypothetical protein